MQQKIVHKTSVGQPITPRTNGVLKNKKNNYTQDEVWEIGRHTPKTPADLQKPQLSETARYIGKTRYALRNNKGEPIESSKDMFWRVASNIATADLLYDPDKGKMLSQTRRFYDIMSSQKFIPNTPTMLNAGKPMQQLSACFVLPVADDMRSIGKTLVDMMLIHKSGGGTGFSFSRLRPYGDLIRSSGGNTVGPCAFLHSYNDVTSQVKQGGVRRGANMGILHITHPDVLRFAVMKVDEFNLTNFNISVTVTEDWMEQVERDSQYVDKEPDWTEIIDEIKTAQTIRDIDLKLKKTEDGVAKLYDLVRATHENEGYELVNPRNGQVMGRLNAKKVFLLITQLAWNYGDPGMIMIDRINKSGANPTPHLGQIEATNPCGEQPLLPYDACTLGSINVGQFVKDGEIDYEELGKVTEESVHFLDNVLDMNNYPIPAIADMTRKIRRIGLGLMGFADLLAQMEIGYNTPEGLQLAEDIMEYVQKRAKKASVDLAGKRGSFPAWKGSIFDPESSHFLGEELHIRNAAVTTIAPTGTIAMLADASSGIEPYFALSFAKNTIEGKRLFTVNPFFLEVAKREGFYSQELVEKIEENGGSVQGVAEVPERWQKVFATTRDITPDWHVKMQAAFQRHVDNAISKTINFPNEATVEDVRKSYLMVYETGCKGITIYRDGSREKQVLEVKKDKSYYDQLAGKDEKKPEADAPKEEMVYTEEGPTKAPVESWGMRLKKRSDVGNVYTAVFRTEEGRPIEVFVNVGKSGGYVAGAAEVTGRLASLALKHGASLGEVADELVGVACGTSYGLGPNAVLSMFDAVGKSVLEISSTKQLPLEFGAKDEEVVEATQSESNGHSKHPVEERDGNGTSHAGEAVTMDVFGHSNTPTYQPTFSACPDCGSTLLLVEGCKKCSNPGCGYSKC
ncbi:ribonucleoside-diphosphate reductase, adenosylcobalamin-dependent [Candidatus Woesebacteria bacterium]|nr:ribonucleoside-diphosphate reductase, adenosylcobalamin-dependent [Candidatus Woesebacteria bacterium]